MKSLIPQFHLDSSECRMKIVRMLGCPSLYYWPISVDDVVQALDIAGHDLDMMDPENFNYIIYNNGTYEELFDEVWRMCQSNIEFNNYTAPLRGRTHDANTYIRFVSEYDDGFKCRLCAPNGIAKVTHSVIHLAPSPVTTLIDESCCGVS